MSLFYITAGIIVIGERPREGALLQSSLYSCGNKAANEEILEKEGITDFTKYAVNPQQKLMADLFI